MKNLKMLSLLTLVIGAISCRPEVNEQVNLPIAESYSPGYVKTYDTVSVIGQSLSNSTISVGSEEVSLIKNTDNELQLL